MPDEKISNTRDRRRPGRAGDEPPAQAARALASGAGAAADRRTLAQRTLGRFAIPVSELVGAAAGFSVSAQRPGCVRDHRRDRQIHRGLCRFRRAADPLRRRGDAARAAATAPPASSPRPRTARSRRTMSSSPPVPISAPWCRICCASIRCFRSMPAATAIPNSFRRARCWWSAPARRARRSPRNCSAPAAASISRSDGTAACRAATAAAT